MGATLQDISARSFAEAIAFGQLVRTRRRTLGLKQADVALAAGVSRDFLIDLERGKPTAEIGKALLAARAVGLSLTEMFAPSAPADDLPEPLEEDDVDLAPRIF